MRRYHPWRVVGMGLGAILTGAPVAAILFGLPCPYPLALLAAGAVLIALASGLADPLLRIVSRWHPLRMIAFLGGAALLGIDMTAVYTGMVDQSQPAYLIAGGLVMTACSGILDPMARFVWSLGNKPLAILCWVMLPVALSQVVTNALDRAGAARDAQVRQHEERANRIKLAQDALADAKQAKKDAEAQQRHWEGEAAKEAKRGGCKGICETYQAQAKKYELAVQDADARIAEARADLASIGPPTEDPRIKRIAALLPFLSKETIETYEPVVMPLGIPLLGLLLIDVSLMPSRKVTRRKAVAQRKKKKVAPRRPSPRKNPKVAALTTGSVVPLRAKRS